MCWFSSRRAEGARGLGVVLECRKGATQGAEERIQQARDALQLRQVTLGSAPADVSQTSTAIPGLLGRVKFAVEELSRAFQ